MALAARASLRAGADRRLHPAAHRAARPGARLVMRVGIVGSGLIGHKRARHLAGAKLTVVCDLDLGRAELLANNTAECRATTQLAEVFQLCDLVIVCTANHVLCDI